MPAPEIIHRLVARFEENRDAYRSGRYNEAQLREEFLNPFFKALGWDVYNDNDNAPQYREVLHEDSIDIEGKSKAPDYAFRIGPERKFFVEAKKPAVDIEYGFHPAYQLRRYAWNAHLPLSILTDFEEFAVYDCRSRPNPGDKAATGRLMILTYKQYIEKWDEIAAIFSPDAIRKGSFDKYVTETKGKKGTTEVDDEFLKDIEEWRLLLARNLALRNPRIADERQLNYAVQMTIDRIIFLRICEDRGIEPDEQLLTLAQSSDIFPALLELFRKADRKYNSGLFHFSREKGSPTSEDTFTPTLSIDDKVLKDIIKSMYFPCPYIFKEIPVEILGQVYEQFLGRVIRLTAGHQAKVEEKPEVRKAGGVYYTPSYIVDYIVKNTVGKLLEGKTPAEAASLKIVDPACGSGSFLLGAFQYLIDWHEDWYINHDIAKWAKGKGPALVATSGGGWKLTTEEKKRILLNNIHGVDIDAQAVEVTKLSLLLKVLEEESGQLSLGLERVLPDLGRNIQCGNSLIGEDYFEGRLVVDEDEHRRVNPFDWQAAFPQVFKQGGFDAVIGNPPYVRQEMLGNTKEYYQSHYRVYHGMADLYSYFIERGVGLLRENGLFCYIVANKWMRAGYGEAMRKWLKTKCLLEITDFGDLHVFENATTYPCILRISKQNPNDTLRVTVVQNLNFQSLDNVVKEEGFDINQNTLSDRGWALSQPHAQTILDKLKIKSEPLSKFTNGKIFRGIITGLNEVFVIDEETKKKLINEDRNSSDLLKPFLIGKDIKRYQPSEAQRYLIFIPKGWTREHIDNLKNAWDIFKGKYPAIAKHLEPFTKEAEKRWDKGDYWWELRACDYYDEFEKPKIIYPNICKQPEFSFDTLGTFTNQKCFIIPTDSKYLLGILNSKISNFFFGMVLPKLRGGFYEPSYIFLKDFPVRKINFSAQKEKECHNRIVSLVERMLALHKKTPRTPQEKESLQREIASTDRQIDKLVYELYGLRDEEIKIVESNS
jgi:hypothetical protein